MATIGNRAIAYVAEPLASDGVAGSAWQTATIDFVTAEKFGLAVRAVQAANVSAPPEIYVYRSTDGGATFESVAMTSWLPTRAASADEQKILSIEGGLYAVALQAGGPDTATVGLDTVEVLSAYVGN